MGVEPAVDPIGDLLVGTRGNVSAYGPCGDVQSMKITHEELILLRDGCRKEFIEMSADACLLGTFKALNMSDRIAVAWLQSAIQVLNAKGLIRRQLSDDHLLIELHQPDYTTATDGYDSSVEMDDESTPT